MFVVIYQFEAKPGMENEFRQAWAEHTEEIKQAYGTFGSRLHKNEDGKLIAYAQWPNRKDWEKAVALETAARKRMLNSRSAARTVFCMDVLDDLLVHKI